MQNEGECLILEDISLYGYFIADKNFKFNNFFIAYAMHILDSAGILYNCLSILNVLTLYILIRSLQFSICFDYILCFFLQIDLYCLALIFAIDIFIIVIAIFAAFLWAYLTTHAWKDQLQAMSNHNTN
jgi:hypothetical protein